MKYVDPIVQGVIWILLLGAIAGFAISIRGVRGKGWIVAWAGLEIFLGIWYRLLGILGNSEKISWETYRKLTETLAPVTALMACLGGVFVLLFVFAQRRGTGSQITLANILFSFRGRIPRQHYWVAVIALNSVSFVTAAVSMAAAVPESSFSHSLVSERKHIVAAIVQWGWVLLTIWPGLAVQVKRWHDRGKSGWMVLVALIPCVGAIWSLVELGCLAGTPGPNQFGEDPLAERPKKAKQARLSGDGVDES
jgi:uncharacterized membrane protein YhaH (DUF805 family)